MLKPLADLLFNSLIQGIFLFSVPSAINGIGLGQKATLREWPRYGMKRSFRAGAIDPRSRYAIAPDSRLPIPDSRLPTPDSRTRCKKPTPV
ncbi:MAG: hypothetical protein F6K10_14355, partial [Moorea sp. SIO2B7]|nr:hypothetical protein [Moorena sp. SIO2B7]